MLTRSVLGLGLLALVACAGCASSTGPFAGNAANDAVGQASPGTIGDRSCEGGWYDRVAGVCDSIGD